MLCPMLRLFFVLGLLMSAQGEAAKVWRRNMDLGNQENWVGFTENCGSNIFTFPSEMDTAVVTMPTMVQGKQIILPSSGYLVFQPGRTVFTDQSNVSCNAREGIFSRRKPANWLDPANWEDEDNQLNSAVGHVERVPCQFDSVKFKENSSFFLTISEDVRIRRFYLGNKTLSYTDLALFMSTDLGRIQFQKESETVFQLDENSCDEDKTCICRNYNQTLQQKICSFVTCTDVEEGCNQGVIMPHGFCCPVCGLHIKIKHNERFSIQKLRAKLKALPELTKSGVQNHATQYKAEASHVVLIPPANVTIGLKKIIQSLLNFITEDPNVIHASISKYSEDIDGSSASASTGVSGTSIFFFLLLLIALGGVVVWFGIFKRPLPSMGNLSSFWPSISFSWCPSCPNLSSVLRQEEGPSFAFARFANERISQLNLNSAFERTEPVDTDVSTSKEEPSPINASTPAVTAEFENAAYGEITDTDAKASTSGSLRTISSEHVYDLIEVADDSSAILSGSTSEIREE